LAVSVALAGCVDGFRGSNIQIDLSPGTPVQSSAFGPMRTGELPAPIHYTLYAVQQDPVADRLFEITRFELHHIVDKDSPCFIDVGEHVPHQGLHVTQFANRIQQDTGILNPASPPPTATEEQKEAVATALLRMGVIDKLIGPGCTPGAPCIQTGFVAITSASTSTYPAVATGCGGPSDQIPPPMCMDNASNDLRLKLCQAAWKADPNLWEGTDRVLTAPLNGITHGMIDLLMNPISMTPVGGAQFFVDNTLDNVDAYAIYFQADGMDTPGTQLYFGRPTMPTRGVLHVHLVSPLNPMLTSEMAIFADLGQDDVHF
jgi:hypothetical protein